MNVEELRKLSCANCDCDDPDCGLMLRARCHPDVGALVKYFKNGHAIQISCKACKALIASVELPSVS